MSGKISYEEGERRLNVASGRIVRAWADLETTLCFGLQNFLATDQFRTRIVWMSLSNFRSRLNLLMRLGETYLSAEGVEHMRRLERRMKRLAKTRNTIAHCVGGFHTEDQLVRYINDIDADDVGVDFIGEQTFTIHNLESFPDAIDAVRRDYYSLGENEGVVLYRETKMHREPPDRHSHRSGPRNRSNPEAQPSPAPKPLQITQLQFRSGTTPIDPLSYSWFVRPLP